MPIQKIRKYSFPRWRLPNGTIYASENELESASSSCERWEAVCAVLVVLAVIAEFAIAAIHPPYDSFLQQWGTALADAGIALGIVGEVLFSRKDARIQTELRDRSNKKLSDAIERAAKADLARAELEAKLLPRMLNQEQWDHIQELRDKFTSVSIAYETDAETRLFAGQIRDAFFSAGISVAMYRRAADIHNTGILIFEPKGFEGSHPRTVEPFVEIFRKADMPVALGIIGALPTDVALAIENERSEMRAPLDVPMIIIGGRFVIPPPHIEKAAMAAKAAMTKIARESSM
jgi:hypothetical protein